VLLPAAHRSLAARVIDQAVRDVLNPNGALTDSASARAFLSGSPMLSYWCVIAELDLDCVIDRARTLMAAGRRGRAGSAEVPLRRTTRRNMPLAQERLCYTKVPLKEILYEPHTRPVRSHAHA
jgi:hypothetical protein